MQPLEIRDIAIECIGRLNGTAATVKEACTDAFFLRYSSACGQVMGGFVQIINDVVHLHPELKPGDKEWALVASRRQETLALPASLQGQELVKAEVETAAKHVRHLREQDQHGALAETLNDIEARLQELVATLKDWEPSAQPLVTLDDLASNVLAQAIVESDAKAMPEAPLQSSLDRFSALMSDTGVSWDGMWFGGAAIRANDSQFVLAFGHLRFTTAGFQRPPLPDGRFIDEPEVLVATCALPIDKATGVLACLGSHRLPPEISELFGSEVLLPTAPNGPRDWSVSWGSSWQGHTTCRVTATRPFGNQLFEVVSQQSIQDADTAVQRTSPPFDGLNELAKTLEFRFASDFRVGACVPVFEVSAGIPLWIEEFRYHKGRQGYLLRVRCGEGIPLDRTTLALTPKPRLSKPLAEIPSGPSRNGLRTFELLVPSKPLATEVAAKLFLGNQVVGELKNTAIAPSFAGQGRAKRTAFSPAAESELQNTYDTRGSTVVRGLRALVGPGPARRAQNCLEAALLLHEGLPLYAIIAAGSVVELLLRRELVRRKAATLRAFWATHGGQPGKPPAKYDLHNAITCAEGLGLVPTANAAALAALRRARNQVHIDVGPPGQQQRAFTPADAIGAIKETLDILEHLAGKRSRRRVEATDRQRRPRQGPN